MSDNIYFPKMNFIIISVINKILEIQEENRNLYLEYKDFFAGSSLDSIYSKNEETN